MEDLFEKNEVTYLYISGITTRPKQSECNVNSYNKDTIAMSTCKCPDLMKNILGRVRVPTIRSIGYYLVLQILIPDVISI